MLKKDTSLNLNSVPNESNIELKTILDFYEDYLMSKIFVYHLDNDVCIKLKFHKSNFCHLLGLHYITSPNTNHIRYEGNFGYNKIKKDGLSFETLESINKHEYELNKNRIIYFPFVYQLLQNPNAIDFDKTKIGKCNVDCKIMFYDEYHNVNIHLGIRGNTEYFFPVTFLVELIGNTYKGDKFIQKQKTRKVYKVDIQPRFNEDSFSKS